MFHRPMAVWPGKSYPLGATWDGEGVNFALFSEHAEKVELCLFDPKGRQSVQRVPMRWRTDQVWHCYLPEAVPGLLYGYRVFGPYDPERGHRFNPNKLLLDPYARAFFGRLQWSDAHFGYRMEHPREDLSFDRHNNAPVMPKCRVIDPAFTWGDDRPPRTPWHDTVIYELHVKGFTIQHPDVPPMLRGTYAGLGTEPVIEHLRSLGVTAVELMPIHAFVDERALADKGLCNYWGYNSIGFFAPEMRYSATEDVNEFKTMVKRLHSAGIEVILDVVYNHTAEGSHLGPTLAFRGIDNFSYYRLVKGNQRYYMDYTGCGNTLNMRHPRVLQLIMDSLRYWVQDMHVDGFRFDLASALARELHEVDRLSAFLDIIHQDPIISHVKLIAEPWDLGEGGYQVGNFPVGWTEWNGKYRDAVRSYWKGEGGVIAEMGYRLTGSSDLYETGGRRPYASINFVTSHDGFTLHDLVSYNRKDNQANLEDNRDGTDDNRSWNCGASDKDDGPTTDPAIEGLRARQKRNFLFTLLLSQGVPMLAAGDEMGRTQQGNNNAYCQDNTLSWVDWNLKPEDKELLSFARRLVEIRQQHRSFRRSHFFQGRPIKAAGVKDIIWVTADGHEMTDDDWDKAFARTLGLFMAGQALEEHDKRGRPVLDDDFLLLLNAHHETVSFELPKYPSDVRWRVLIDTSQSNDVAQQPAYEAGKRYSLRDRSAVLLTALKELVSRAEGIRSRHISPFGAECLEDGGVRFRLWAPAAETVDVILESAAGEEMLPAAEQAKGCFELIAERASAGTRYAFRIDGDSRVPDPASRFQPEDVHGPSQVVDPESWVWSDGDWKGKPWEEVVLYELHVGTFSPKGTFAGAKERLDHLVELGITAVELMPVADFCGRRNWGYDGVLHFAPDSQYGTPDDLKDFVDTAHAKGLMVFLDVVYNHFGPEGNYLSAYAPQFFTDRYDTPWGEAIDFEGPKSRTVRDFFIHNALYWIEEYHLDGLRLDAVHAIFDASKQHILMELAEAVHQGPGADRRVHLVLENDDNQARYLKRDAELRPLWYAAQWNDDIHHALHVLSTGETDGYYGDYADVPIEHLGRCLAQGFAYQGEPSAYRGGAARGSSTHGLPVTAFVSFLQNHDQVGNRALGERLSELASEDAVRAVTAILLLAPSPPLLFMGQEWGSRQPFPFFCDFGSELASAVTRGRRQEFSRFAQFATSQAQARIPDPNDTATFLMAKLDWDSMNREEHRQMFAFHRALLSIRRQHITPRLYNMAPNSGSYRVLGPQQVLVRWLLGDRSELTLLANLGPGAMPSGERPLGHVLYASTEGSDRVIENGALPGWTAVWFLNTDTTSQPPQDDR